jgi:hypothetical protein
MTEEELGALVRLLQEKTPLGVISNMEARTVFEFAQQRGYTISKPIGPIVCGTCQAVS